MRKTNQINETKKNKPLVILDWDDTLFPTFWLSSNHTKIKKRMKCILTLYDDKLCEFMNYIIKWYNVVIITNSSRVWVQMTLDYLPKTKCIVERGVNIISARDLYNGSYVFSEWKKMAFMYNIMEYVKRTNQVISIGDAIFERDALMHLGEFIRGTHIVKTIKLSCNPTITTMVIQFCIIKKIMRKLCDKSEDTHLQINI